MLCSVAKSCLTLRPPFPPPGNLQDPGIEPTSPALAGKFFTAELSGKPH